ncbi:molecular chaperone TorD [Thalassotalea sp. ND16A]|uniref:molecular chaperone TorD n=1 Tax=Thalassotalea sp. ND16A TaxID=1535422 RepID=UPI00051A20CA|nr:molecular chaperone TorD [Thalassotalea sp. ND16A]KGJ91082.1 hypothetical protein ND16A_0158 [Thalassotalea sp. ND16A]
MNSINSARAMFYGLLSSLFAKEVERDLLSELMSEQGQVFLQHLANEDSFQPHIGVLNDKLKSLSSERDLLELAADFCGLFLVSGKHSASPYAGQYLEKDSAELFGEYHQSMVNFLTEHEMQLHSDFPEPADHIAVIFAYLSYLCSNASRAEQLSFIDNYLLTWVESFAQQVQQHDQQGFYSALASLSRAWLEFDRENLVNENADNAE